MIRVDRYPSFETALEAFSEKSKPRVKEHLKNAHFSPEKNKRKHKSAKSAGGNHRPRKQGRGGR